MHTFEHNVLQFPTQFVEHVPTQVVVHAFLHVLEHPDAHTPVQPDEHVPPQAPHDDAFSAVHVPTQFREH